MSNPLRPVPQPPSAVFVDAGGVLVLPDLEMTCAHLGRAELTEEQRYHAFFRAFERRDESRPEQEWLWEAFADEVAADDAEAIAALTTKEVDPWYPGCVAAPGASAFLRTLFDAGIPTIVVSNANGTVAEMLRAAGVCQVGDGPLAPVTAIIDSHVVGVAKPNPRIFHIARQHVAHVELQDAVHVGDALWSDVAAADAAGIPVVHLDPERTCAAPDAHEHAVALDDVLEQIGVDD